MNFSYNTAFNTQGADGLGYGAPAGPGIQLSTGLTLNSTELLLTAQPIMMFNSIVTEKSQPGTQPFETIRFFRYAALTGDAALTEGQPMGVGTTTVSQVDITVTEHGKAHEVTEARLRTEFTGTLQAAAQLLGRHYALYQEGRIRNALVANGNTIYANDRATRAELVATDVFNTEIIRDAVEQLAINKAPKFGGDAYVCFVTPRQARKLRSDPAWISAQHYAGSGNIFRGEIGRFEDVRFIETTLCQTIKAGTGKVYADNRDTLVVEGIAPTVDVSRALIVGDHCIGHATALPVEMRDNGVQDYGRIRGIGWYCIDGFGIIEPGHIFAIETA